MLLRKVSSRRTDLNEMKVENLSLLDIFVFHSCLKCSIMRCLKEERGKLFHCQLCRLSKHHGTRMILHNLYTTSSVTVFACVRNETVSEHEYNLLRKSFTGRLTELKPVLKSRDTAVNNYIEDIFPFLLNGCLLAYI